jgi:hypothetical protein
MSYLLKRTAPYCHDALVNVIDAARHEVGCTQTLGGRVWLVPRWFYRAYSRQNQNVLAFAELGRGTIGRPVMYRAAQILGPVGRPSSVRWTIHKGLVGRLTFRTKDFQILQHTEYWPRNLGSMTKEDWSKEPQDSREYRTLKDAKDLRDLYGTAVGVQLRHISSGYPLGCITIHTSAEEPLDWPRAIACAGLLQGAATPLAEIVARVARLH